MTTNNGQGVGVGLWPDPHALGPVTDLYQLTMMAGYHAVGMAQRPAVFELFVRRLPAHRGYLVFAGLEQALTDLVNLRFSDEQVAYLKSHPSFAHIAPEWFEHLAAMRFRGDLWSVPEGTAVFANEPIVRVTGTLEETQWVETFLLASLNYPTIVASKAARIIRAAQGRGVFDFGARRGHGPHSGFLCARSSRIAGFQGTSHVEAGRRLDIPVVGTMAHAWVQAFPDETTAFQAFANVFPHATTLLVDTYDTLHGVSLAARIEPPIQAIRIDSGDPITLSRAARTILNDAGRRDVKIVVSGDLDEWKIAKLVAAEAPIDVFGVGTELITGGDAPSLSMVYKLVELDGAGRIKLSPGKKTYPLGKQVHRQYDATGKILRDYVTEQSESVPGHTPLLQPMIRRGELVEPWPSLAEVQRYCEEQCASLPAAVAEINADATVPVFYSDRLEAESHRLGVN